MHDPFSTVPVRSSAPLAPPSSLLPPPPDWSNDSLAKSGPSYAQRSLQPIEGLATAVKALTGATAFAAVLTLGAAFNEYRVIGGSDRLAVTVTESDTAAGWTAAAVLLGLLLMIVTGVCSIVLLWRMTNNDRDLQGRDLEHKTHWVLWGWFVPLLNLVRPMQMVRQIWRTADEPGGKPIGPPGALGNFARTQHSSDAPVSVWWGTWVGSNLIAAIWPSASWQNPTLDEIRVELVGTMVGSVMTMVSAAAFIYVVTHLVRRQLPSATARGFIIQ